MNIRGAHIIATGSIEGTLGAAGVKRVWAGDGPQRAAYRGGGISCGLACAQLVFKPKNLKKSEF